jgi:hypothetical protein
MGSAVRLPVCFPVGSKYVLEACGPFVRRYVEFPNGRRVKLAKRKALPCGCLEWQQISIVPDQRSTPVNSPSKKPVPERAS